MYMSSCLTHIHSCAFTLSCAILSSMITRDLLLADSRVQRLLNNPNWKPAAEAAIKFFLEGKHCPIISWRKSSTWAQVEMVWGELKAGESSQPPA